MSTHFIKPVLIIAFLMSMGTWLLTFGWTRVRTDQQLDRRSAVTEGRVVDGSTHRLSKGGQTSTLIVEFVPDQQAAITREFDVDRSTYQSGLDSGKVTVTYLPEDPRVSRVTRFDPLPYQILMGFGGLVLLSGLFCLGHFAIRRL